MSLHKRRFQLLLIYALCLLPVVADGARQALCINANSPFEWVPESFRPRQEYEQFRRTFGSGEVLIVSWPGCTIDSPALELFSKSLGRPDLFRDSAGKPEISHVVNGQDALRGLTAPPLRLPREEARQRLRGTLDWARWPDDLRRRHAFARGVGRSRPGRGFDPCRTAKALPSAARGATPGGPRDGWIDGRSCQPRFARSIRRAFGDLRVSALLVVLEMAAGRTCLSSACRCIARGRR